MSSILNAEIIFFKYIDKSTTLNLIEFISTG